VYDTAGEWDTIEMAMGYTSLINCHRLIPSPYHLPQSELFLSVSLETPLADGLHSDTPHTDLQVTRKETLLTIEASTYVKLHDSRSTSITN